VKPVIQSANRIFGRSQKKSKHIEVIDRLHEKRKPHLLQGPARKTQIFNQCAPSNVMLHAHGLQSCQTIHQRSPQSLRIGNCLGNTLLKLAHTVGQTGNSALARSPISGVHIDQRLL
jgi:hypothetical protein